MMQQAFFATVQIIHMKQRRQSCSLLISFPAVFPELSLNQVIVKTPGVLTALIDMCKGEVSFRPRSLLLFVLNMSAFSAW